MAKRMTDTEKFKSKFLRSLKAPYKLLWEYILCDCNHAGIWLVDFEAARMYIGRDVRVFEDRALEEFNKKERHVIPIDNGERWFIVGFIEFQYGALNPRNRVHASVIRLLERFGLWKDGHIDLEMKDIPTRKIPHLEEAKKKKTVLQKPADGTKNEEQKPPPDISEHLANLIQEKQPEGYEGFNFDFVDKDFKEIFYEWLQYKRARREKYKTQSSLQKAYKLLLNLSGNDAIIAKKIIDQSQANNYAGLFKLNDKGYGNKQQTSTAPAPGSGCGGGSSLQDGAAGIIARLQAQDDNGVPVGRAANDPVR